MSYVLAKQPRLMVPRRSRARRGRQKNGYTALAGIFDGLRDIFLSSPAADAASLLNQASCAIDPTPIYSLFAKMGDVGTNWNPTGVYTPDDVFTVVDLVVRMVSPVTSAMLDTATNYNTDALSSAQKDAISVGGRTQDFIAAAQQAKAAGTYVSAPDLKQWVVDEMRVTLDGMVAVAAAKCDQPGWFILLAAYQTGFDAVWAGVKAVAGVVLKLGEKAIAVVGGGLDLIATVEKIAPYAAVGLAAWWIFLREKKRRS